MASLRVIAPLASVTNSGLDRAVLFFSGIGFSVPGFWLAFMALWTFSSRWSTAPSGSGLHAHLGAASRPWVRSITLPAIVISDLNWRTVAPRMTLRREVPRVDGSLDYIRTAMAQSCPAGSASCTSDTSFNEVAPSQRRATRVSILSPGFARHRDDVSQVDDESVRFRLSRRLQVLG